MQGAQARRHRRRRCVLPRHRRRPAQDARAPMPCCASRRRPAPIAISASTARKVVGAREAAAVDRDRRARRHRIAARPAQCPERAAPPARPLLALPEPLPAADIDGGGAGDVSGPRRIAWRRSAGQARVLFINDSKATNADSTEKALLSFPGDIYWILGGKPKEGGITSLAELFPAHRQGLPDRRGDGGVRRDARRQGRLRALRHARRGRGRGGARCRRRATRASPSCCCRRPAPPYDQFRNFEVRGDAFRALVAALPGIAMQRGAAMRLSRADRSRARRLVVHRRSRAARRHPRADRRGARPVAGGQSRGRHQEGPADLLFRRAPPVLLAPSAC